MYLALLKKELREVLPTVAIAAVAYLLLLASATNSGIYRFLPIKDVFSLGGYARPVAFANSSFCTNFWWISVCFVSVLGFQQPLTEEWRGTFRLLLHRPMPRMTIIGLKVGAGIGIFLILGTAVILSLAIWAATPGNQPAPFFWSMTVPAFGALITATLVYLGAFVSALRPARWYGTRLLPWLVSLVIVILSMQTSYSILWLPLCIPWFAVNVISATENRDFA